MASIYSNISENKLKTAVLMMVFSAFVIFLGYIISLYYNNFYILYTSAFAALFTNIFAYWFSDKLALRSVGAVPADEERYKELHRIVENLAITAGIPKPKVYIIPDNALNAFATGRDPKHAAVAVTTGLLETLDKSELEGVIAHELSHIKNRDILVMTVAVVLVGFVATLTDLAFRLNFYSSTSEENNSSKKNPLLLILFLVAVVLAPIFAKLLQYAVSRKREFLADSSGALLTRYPEGLAKALVKISSYGSHVKTASRATAHLFISDPFEKRNRFFSFVAKLFSTHPPVEERIKALLGERASEFLSKENQINL